MLASRAERLTAEMARTLTADDAARALGWENFAAFLAMCDEAIPTYAPTLLCRPSGTGYQAVQHAACSRVLADAYDRACAARGDGRRAYRGAAYLETAPA